MQCRIALSCHEERAVCTDIRRRPASINRDGRCNWVEQLRLDQNTRATRDTASPTRHMVRIPCRSAIQRRSRSSRCKLLKRQNRPSLDDSERGPVWWVFGGCLLGARGWRQRDQQGSAGRFGGSAAWGLPVAWDAKPVRGWPLCDPWLVRAGPAHWMPRRSADRPNPPKSLVCSVLAAAVFCSRPWLAMLLLPLGRAGLS